MHFLYKLFIYIVLLIIEYRNLYNIKIVIITTFRERNNKNFISTLVINSLSNITNKSKHIKVIIYVEKIEKAYQYSKNIIFRKIKFYNKYKTPYFGYLINETIKQYRSIFYMYMNGDIVVTPRIYSIIMELLKYIKKGTLKSIVLCVATRSTICYNKNETYNPHLHDKIYKHGNKSGAYSQDVFLMTNIVYRMSSSIYNGLLIGRAGIDNIILATAIKNHKIDVVDLTNSIMAIHIENCNINKTDYINV